MLLVELVGCERALVGADPMEGHLCGSMVLLLLVFLAIQE